MCRVVAVTTVPSRSRSICSLLCPQRRRVRVDRRQRVRATERVVARTVQFGVRTVSIDTGQTELAHVPERMHTRRGHAVDSSSRAGGRSCFPSAALRYRALVVVGGGPGGSIWFGAEARSVAARSLHPRFTLLARRAWPGTPQRPGASRGAARPRVELVSVQSHVYADSGLRTAAFACDFVVFATGPRLHWLADSGPRATSPASSRSLGFAVVPHPQVFAAVFATLVAGPVPNRALRVRAGRSCSRTCSPCWQRHPVQS